MRVNNSGALRPQPSRKCAEIQRLAPQAQHFFTVLGGENVSLILGGELLALIKSELQRRVVGLQQHIRHDDFVFQLRMFALMPRILVPMYHHGQRLQAK